LDRWFSVPQKPQKMAFPGPDHGRYLVSIHYWTPPIPQSKNQVKELVKYYGEYRMDWDRPPEGRWVAVSFDAFWPPERDSADLIIPLRGCDKLCQRAGL
jgi:hypothetical protein